MNRKYKVGGSSIMTILLIQLTIVVVLLGSWIWNLTKFVGSDFQAPVKREVIHGIGLVPAISVVTCWFNIDETAEPIEVKIVD